MTAETEASSFTRSLQAGALQVSAMKQKLSDQDWERVIFAISQFSHNSDFRETLDRLLKALGRNQAS